MKSSLRKRELSEQQTELRDYLLRRLGFIEGEIKDLYCEALTQYFYENDYVKDFTFTDKKTEKEVSVSVHYTVVDALNDEVKFREEKRWAFKDKIQSSKAISATELAAFSFCPASFSIANTFETGSTREMDIGTQQHEESLLSFFKKQTFSIYQENIRSDEKDRIKPDYIDSNNAWFFEELRNSILIYAGHNDQENRLFYNKQRTLLGQPDYVFQNKTGQNFIVEEKFKSSKEHNHFFANHKVQLASYINGLEEINAQYGYLTYWFYENTSKGLKVTHCKLYKITKSDAAKAYLNGIYNKVSQLRRGVKLAFDVETLSVNKCIRCSFNRWCGHKTGLYKDLQYPYLTNYLKIFVAKYKSNNK